MRNNTKIRKKEDKTKEYSFKLMINDDYKTGLSFNEKLKIFNNISRKKWRINN